METKRHTPAEWSIPHRWVLWFISNKLLYFRQKKGATRSATLLIARPSLLASMDELAAPCPEDSRGSASGLGSERSLIGRPAKPEADKQRSKSWRCTLEAPSEAQQSRIRAAGMDRCTSKLHTADCLVRSLPACPRRRRPVIGARVHRRWRRATAHRMEQHQPGRPIRGPRTPARMSNLCWALRAPGVWD